MEVVITVHEHNLHYKGVGQLSTTRDVVVLILQDNYQVDDKEFVEEHNIGLGGFMHQFVDCSGVFIAEK